MKGISAVVLLLVVGLGVGTYAVTRPVEHGLTRDELGWVRKYDEWRRGMWFALAAAYNGLGRGASLADEVHLLDPLRSCLELYDRDVGEAPEALDSVQEASQNACRDIEGAISEVRTLGDAGLGQAKRDLFEGYRDFERAASRLDERLLMTQPLPTLEGRRAVSRVEPRFSEVATRITGIKMDVRCWSNADWPEVSREAATFNPEHPKGTIYFGVAGIWGGAANLSPGVCAAMVRFAYLNELPTSRGASRRLIDALVTLGHEVAHATGTENEFEAECLGHQHVRAIARELGASRARANQLAVLGWEMYTKRELGSPQLWSPKCRSGGPFDLTPGGAWP